MHLLTFDSEFLTVLEMELNQVPSSKHWTAAYAATKPLWSQRILALASKPQPYNHSVTVHDPATTLSNDDVILGIVGVFIVMFVFMSFCQSAKLPSIATNNGLFRVFEVC